MKSRKTSRPGWRRCSSRGLKSPVIPGRCAALNPESRDSPMCNRTSEVWSFGPSRNDGIHTGPHPEERRLRRVSKDGGIRFSRFETRAKSALLTMRHLRSIHPRLARLLGGLHQIETPLDLAARMRKILALLRGEARQDLLLAAQQARDQFPVQRAALPRQAQLVLAAVVFVLDALHQLPLHQRGHRAADGGFVGPGAMRDVLRAARLVTKAKRRQHPPFRTIQPVS